MLPALCIQVLTAHEPLGSDVPNQSPSPYGFLFPMLGPQHHMLVAVDTWRAFWPCLYLTHGPAWTLSCSFFAYPAIFPLRLDSALLIKLFHNPVWLTFLSVGLTVCKLPSHRAMLLNLFRLRNLLLNDQNQTQDHLKEESPHSHLCKPNSKFTNK